MDFDRSTWVPAAQALPRDRTRRLPHGCGGGQTLLVSRSASGGLRAWCFRCNQGDSVAAPEPTLHEVLDRLRAHRVADETASTMVLPAPAVHDPALWPEPARVWLYRAGLGGPEIARLGAYYHAATGRVVLPVMQDGVPVFWQARSVDGRQPKYLAPAVDKAGIVPKYGTGQVIHITEDLLSAFKVGMVAEAWCALGTRMGPGLCAALLADPRPVRLLLDPDVPGVKAANVMARTLRGFGRAVSVVHLARDPKLFHLHDLQTLLQQDAHGT
jgi:hypothetical protein